MRETILNVIYLSEGISLENLCLRLMSFDINLRKENVYEIVDELLAEDKIIALHCYRTRNNGIIKIKTVLFSADLKFECSREDLLDVNKTSDSEVKLDRKSESNE